MGAREAKQDRLNGQCTLSTPRSTLLSAPAATKWARRVIQVKPTMQRLHFTIAAAGLCLAAPLAAQTCAGAPSFADGRLAVGGSVTSGNDASILGAAFSYGRPMGTSFGVAVSHVNYDRTAVNSTSIGANIGHELSPPSRPSVSMCPLASLARGFGPDAGLTETNTVTLSGGASVGAAIPIGSNVTGVPFFGASFVHLRTTSETAGVEDSNTDSFLTFTAGFGLVINRTFGFTPSVRIPAGLEGADPTFTLAVQYNFGRK
jgi:hypothetical protein